MSYIGGSFEFNPELIASDQVADVHDQIGVSKEKILWTNSGRSGFAFVLSSWRDKLLDGWEHPTGNKL